MICKKTLIVSIIFCISALLSAQELLEIDIKHRCVYSGNYMDEELYAFPSDAKEMESRVKKILELGGDLKANFYLVETNVENVSAVVYDNKRYLLWSQDFFLNAGDIEKIGTTAHEMAHHLNKHSLKADRREKEEAEADFFMGYVFSKTKFKENDIRAFVQKMPLSGHTGFNEKRFRNIMNGFEKGLAKAKFKSLGFDEDPSLVNFLNAQFPFPPPECHTAHEILNNYFSSCHSLGSVSKKISQSLEKKQYPYKYMSVPNGFAIVTQMEQYNTDGSIMTGSTYRWVDYPPQESFALSWNYIKSLIYPKKGHLRLFVFLVTSQNYSSDKRRVSKEDAEAWLSQGVNRLPKSISSEPFNSDYSVSLLTYEFEVPESNHQVRQSCPCHYQAVEHLSLTGLNELLKNNP